MTGPDHPRSRGVYFTAARSMPACQGSSPLARGLPGPPSILPCRPRIIPARAGFTAPPASWASPGPDHPRSRGVYSPTLQVTSTCPGSSPLARGLPRTHNGLVGRSGIIPARAGFTAGRAAGPAGAADHPRSRGVYLRRPVRVGGVRGSSPLARGLLTSLPSRVVTIRIIPARAGFTSRSPAPPRRTPDHPRSRGVYSDFFPAMSVPCGSSPLARGLPGVLDTKSPRSWIIPARAGFTWCTVGRRRPRPDHPRSRGVYGASCDHPGCEAGSSPLARGLHRVQDGGLALGGIIPARAGFTRRAWPRPDASGDHPRSRGVYRLLSHVRGRLPGSSPLARGLPHPRRGQTGHGRIIPARAGFTRAWIVSSPPAQDHPRSRGVYTGNAINGRKDTGSSPLARGLHHPRTIWSIQSRIIPARAGFTRAVAC